MTVGLSPISCAADGSARSLRLRADCFEPLFKLTLFKFINVDVIRAVDLCFGLFGGKLSDLFGICSRLYAMVLFLLY